MTVTDDRLREALDRAVARGEPVLVEPEGFPILDAIGVARPQMIAVDAPGELQEAALTSLETDRVVVKIASSAVLHRSDVGGVAVLPCDLTRVREAMTAMGARIAAPGRRRYTISRFVPHHVGPGGELLLSLRWTSEFGPVVTVGPGGVYAEALARHLREGDDVAVMAAEGLTRARAQQRLRRLPFVRAVTGALRGQRALTSDEALADAVLALAAFGLQACPSPVLECEVNPLAVTAAGLVALDVLVRIAPGPAERVPPARPLHRLPSLLTPRSIAIAGVSEHMNPGRVILRNLLREGFPREAITVVKPDTGAIDGCRAVGSLPDLPAAVDLLVLSVAARHVPGMLLETIEGARAESVIVIPGGLEEKAGGAAPLARVHESLARARGTAWGGPLINGGNCLGIRSRPGRYDTMFIPPEKMPARLSSPTPLALISQSGAFAIARTSKLGVLDPTFLITVGNQMDLTVGDYLAWLADDASLRVFAVYVEGFRPGDGLRLMQAARRITESGRLVILYRAGRTPAGAAASASHTASMAGDYVATRELAAASGVVLVDSIEAFEDLTRVAVALDARRPRGPRLGAVSNAGFECVAMADNLGPLTLAVLSDGTRSRLSALFSATHIDAVVDVHNPLDVTPMTGDAAFVEAVRVVLEDDGVDIGLVGCVPLTPSLETLAPATGHAEDAGRDTAVAGRLARLWADTRKPWVAVVDAGAEYDALVRILDASGLVTFRSADRALRALTLFCQAAGLGATE